MAWSLKKEEKYTVFTADFSSDNQLIDAISLLNIEGNKIIDCSSETLSESVIEKLAIAYQNHFNEQLSFVVVISAKEDMDEVEEHFIAVPTISEAIDYIYMEELERNF